MIARARAFVLDGLMRRSVAGLPHMTFERFAAGAERQPAFLSMPSVEQRQGQRMNCHRQRNAGMAGKFDA